ncbi:MAG: hypothetical protein JNK32_09780 [Anaerolineales bacterium]|nr:hypothetical protein [Anaerolineales bacterium]
MNISSMSLEQVRAERRRIASEIQELTAQNEALLGRLNQNLQDPQQASTLIEEMYRQSRRSRDLARRDDLLNAHERTRIAEQNAQAIQDAAQPMQRASTSDNSNSNSGIGCGISAFAGIAGVIGFALYFGVSRWDFKSVMIMIGVGLGIAIIGWVGGYSSK